MGIKALSGVSPDTSVLNDNGGSERPWLSLALRVAHFVRSKKSQGLSEPYKGKAWDFST
jgi:hypothetical protein